MSLKLEAAVDGLLLKVDRPGRTDREGKVVSQRTVEFALTATESEDLARALPAALAQMHAARRERDRYELQQSEKRVQELRARVEEEG